MAESDQPGGCVFASTAWEFDDRPGPVRDHTAASLRELLATIERSVRIAIEEGHFRADLDVHFFAYQAHTNLLGYHVQARLLGAPDARLLAQRTLDQLIADARVVSSEA